MFAKIIGYKTMTYQAKTFYLGYKGAPDFAPTDHKGKIVAATGEISSAVTYYSNVSGVQTSEIFVDAGASTIVTANAFIAAVSGSADSTWNRNASYVIYGHDELGAGIIVHSLANSVDTYSLVMTEGLMKFLNRPSMSAFIAMSGTGVTRSPFVCDITKLRQEASNFTSLANSAFSVSNAAATAINTIGTAGPGGAATVSTILKIVALIVAVQKLGSYVGNGSVLSVDLQVLQSEAAGGNITTGVSALTAIVNNCNSYIQTFKAAYIVANMRMAVVIDADLTAIEADAIVPFSPTGAAIRKAISSTSNISALEAYVHIDMCSGNQPWVRTLELLATISVNKYISYIWPLLPMTFSDRTGMRTETAAPDSLVAALAGAIDAISDANRWLFFGIYAPVLRAVGKIPATYDPADVLTSWNAAIAALDAISTDIVGLVAQDRVSFRTTVGVDVTTVSTADLYGILRTRTDVQYHAKYFASIYDKISTLTDLQIIIANNGLATYLMRLILELFDGKTLTNINGMPFQFTMNGINSTNVLSVKNIREKSFKTIRAVVPTSGPAAVLTTLTRTWLTLDAVNATLIASGAISNAGNDPALGPLSNTTIAAVNAAIGTANETILIVKAVVGDAAVDPTGKFVSNFVKFVQQMPYEKDFMARPGAYGIVALALSDASISDCIEVMLKYPIISLALGLQAKTTASGDCPTFSLLYGGILLGLVGRSCPFDPEDRLSNVDAAILAAMPQFCNVADNSGVNEQVLWSDLAARLGYHGEFAVTASWQTLHEQCYRTIYTALYAGISPTSVGVLRWLSRFRNVTFETYNLAAQTISASDFAEFQTLVKKYGSLAYRYVTGATTLSLVAMFNSTFYPSKLFTILQNDSFGDLLISCLWVEEPATYVFGSGMSSPTFVNLETTVVLGCLVVDAISRWISNGSPIPSNCLWAIYRIASFIGEHASPGDTLRSIIETNSIWNILAGKNGGSPYEDMMIFKSVASAQNYLGTIAATYPHRLFGISNIPCNGAEESLEALVESELIDWSYGAQLGTLTLSYVEKPMPWNGFAWSSLKTRSVAIVAPGEILQGNRAKSDLIPIVRTSNVRPSEFDDLFGGQSLIVRNITVSQSELTAAETTLLGETISSTGSLLSIVDGSACDPLWSAGYMIFRNSAAILGVRRVSSRINGLGIVVGKIDSSRQTVAVKPIFVSHSQTSTIFAGSTNVTIVGTESATIDISAGPVTVTIVIVVGGIVVDISDDIVGIPPSVVVLNDCVYDDVSSLTSNIWTLPGTGSTFNPNSGTTAGAIANTSVTATGCLVRPGSVAVVDGAIIYSNANDLLGEVGYIVYSGQANSPFSSVSKVVRIARYPNMTGILSVNVGPSGVVAAITTGANWFFMLDGVNIGSSGSGTSLPFARTAAYQVIRCVSGSLSVDALLFDGAIVQVSENVVLPHAKALIPMSGLESISFESGTYVAVLWRTMGAYTRDEKWNILRGFWNAGSIIDHLTGISARIATAFPSVLTLTGAHAIYVGAISTLAAGTELLTAEGWAEFAQIWPIIQAPIKGNYFFPNTNLISAISIGENAIPTAFLALAVPNGAGSAFLSTVSTESGVWKALETNSVAVGKYISSLFGHASATINDTIFSASPIADMAILKKCALDSSLYASWAGLCLKFGVTSVEFEQIFSSDNAAAMIQLMEVGYNGFSPRAILEKTVKWGAMNTFNVVLPYVTGLSNSADVVAFVRSIVTGPSMNSGTTSTRTISTALKAPVTFQASVAAKTDSNANPALAVSNFGFGGYVTNGVVVDAGATVNIASYELSAMYSLNARTMTAVRKIPSSDSAGAIVPYSYIRGRQIIDVRTGFDAASFWAGAAASAAYANFNNGRAVLAVNDGTRTTGISDGVDVARSGSMPLFCNGWNRLSDLFDLAANARISPAPGKTYETNTSSCLTIPVFDIRAYFHTVEDGNASIPTSSMYRNFMGLVSPWFSTYVTTDSGVQLDPSLGVPIFNISDDVYVPGIDTNGAMIPIGMRPFDILLCPATPTIKSAGGIAVSSLYSAYGKFLNLLQNIQYATIPALSIRATNAMDKNFNVAAMCEWSLAASSVTMTGSPKNGISCASAVVPAFANPYGSSQNDLVLRVENAPEVYGPVILPAKPYSFNAQTIPTTGTLNFVTSLKTATGNGVSAISMNNASTVSKMTFYLLEETIPNIFAMVGGAGGTGNESVVLQQVRPLGIADIWASANMTPGPNIFPVLLTSGTTAVGMAPVTISFDDAPTPPNSISGAIYVYCTIYPLQVPTITVAAVTTGTSPNFVAVPTTTLTSANVPTTLPSYVSVGSGSGPGSISVPETNSDGASNYFRAVLVILPTTTIDISLTTSANEQTVSIRSTESASAITTTICQLVLNRPAATTELYAMSKSGNSTFALSTDMTLSAPAKTTLMPLISVEMMRPNGILADVVDEHAHFVGPWAETGSSLRKSEQFWQKMPSEPIPRNIWLGGSNLLVMPDIDPRQWVIVQYDFYGIPDESARISAARRPASEIVLENIPPGGVFCVGLSAAAQQLLNSASELEMTVPVTNGGGGDSVDVTANFRPVSGWGKVSGNRENLSIGLDSRRSMVDVERSTYEPWTLAQKALFLGNRALDGDFMYADMCNSSSNGVYSHVGQSSQVRNLDKTSVAVTGPSSGSVPGSDTIDLTIDTNVLALPGGRFETFADSASISTRLESKTVYVPNRIVAINAVTNVIELDIPIPCAYSEIVTMSDPTTGTNETVLIERTRTTKFIHASKLGGIFSAARRFYGSVTGMDTSVYMTDRFVNVNSIGTGSYAREPASIRCRPGLGTVVSATYTRSPIPTTFSANDSDDITFHDEMSDIPTGTIVLSTKCGSLVGDNSLYVLSSSGIDRKIPVECVSTGTATDLTPYISTGRYGYPRHASPNELIWRSPGYVFSGPALEAIVAAFPWNSICQLFSAGGKYFRRILPGFFQDISPAARDVFFILGSFDLVVTNAAMVARPIESRPTIPFKFGTSASLPIITVVGTGQISTGASRVSLSYGGISVPLTISADQGSLDVTEFTFADGTFSYGGTPIVLPPAFDISVGPATATMPDGLYFTGSQFQILSGGTIVSIPKQLVEFETWDSGSACDFLLNGIAYVTGAGHSSFVTRAPETFWTISTVSDGGSGVLLADESFGVSQMRFSGIFTDPRIAAATMRTTRYPVQLAGPLGNPNEHWSARFGPECAGNHPYFSMSCVRYVAPEIVMMPTTYRTLATPTGQWDVAVQAAIRECDYLKFRSLIHEKKDLFVSRFLTVPLRYAIPTYDPVAKTYACPAISSLLADGANEPGLSTTLICTWMMAMQTLATNYSDDRAKSFMQIFETSVKMIDSPAIAGTFLAIAANMAIPGNSTSTYLSVPAPSGFGISTNSSGGSTATGSAAATTTSSDTSQSSILANSLLSVLESIVVGMFIDDFDDSFDESWTFGGQTYQFVEPVPIDGLCVFSGTIERNRQFVSAGLSAPNDQGIHNITTLGSLPAVLTSDSTTPFPLALSTAGASFVEFDDISQMSDYWSGIATYMVRLLGRIGARGSCGGIPTTNMAGQILNYSSNWRSAADAPWDIAWVGDQTLVPKFISIRGSGYIGSSEYQAIPSPEMMANPVSIATTGPTAETTVGNTTLSVDPNGYLVLTVGNQTSTTIIGGIQSCGRAVSISVPPGIPSAGNVNVVRYVNLMEIVPAHDLYIYGPHLVDQIADAVLVTSGVAFRTNIGEVCAIWSPCNISPFAAKVPCLGNIRTSLANSSEIAILVSQVSNYLKMNM